MTVILTQKISFGIGEFFSTTLSILIILSFCVFLYRISKNERYRKSKYAIVSLSLIFTLHLIAFPFIYTIMLKNNPDSFEFKTSIYTNQKQIMVEEWKNDSRHIPSEIKNLENIRLLTNTVLNKKLKELKQLTFTKNYIIYVDINSALPRGNYMATVYIFDLKGFLENKLYRGGSKSELDSTKFGSVITHDINYLKNKLEYYKIKKAELDRNNVWTFTSLLPYSISSIFTGNMSPITPTANIFYSLHYFIIYCIGIGIFLHFLIMNISILIRNGKS